MDSAQKRDQDCLFGCIRRIIEVISRKKDTGFGFSARKRSKLTIWKYFSESGHPKTDNRKFAVHSGARRSCGTRRGHVAAWDWPAHAGSRRPTIGRRHPLPLLCWATRRGPVGHAPLLRGPRHVARPDQSGRIAPYPLLGARKFRTPENVSRSPGLVFSDFAYK